MEEKNTVRLTSFHGGVVFSLNVIIYLLLLLVASAIVSVLPEDSDGVKYISLLVSPFAVVCTSAIFFRYSKAPVFSTLRVKTHSKFYLIGVMLIFGLLFSLSSLNDLLVDLFELMGYTRKQSFLPDMQGWNVVPVLLTVAVIPALMEEILFRGLILNTAEGGTGSVSAVFLVGMCFALYHGSVEQTVYQFVCGCLFTLLAVRSRAITPTVLIHFLNNAIIIILCACGLTDPVTGEIMLPFVWNVVLIVLSALCLIGAVVWLVLDKTELKKGENGGVKKFFAGASIGIAAMVVMWIANLFV